MNNSGFDGYYIFVYGTLRKGGGRDVATQIQGAKFIAPARVRGRLFDLGAYPGAVLNSGTVDDIIGEVYHIPAEALRELDLIEGCRPDDPATSYYNRRRTIAYCDTGEEITCWIYECNPGIFALSTPIESGNWIEYEQRRGEYHKDSWPNA